MSQLISCFKSFINILDDEEVFLHTFIPHCFLLLYTFCSMLPVLKVYRQQPLQSVYVILCLRKLNYLQENRFDPLPADLLGERHLYVCVCTYVCVQDQFKHSCSSAKSHDCPGLYPYTWIAYKKSYYTHTHTHWPHITNSKKISSCHISPHLITFSVILHLLTIQSFSPPATTTL